MNQNAEAIAILCSHLCVGDGVKPLEPSEWSKLAQRLMEQRMAPKDLLEFSREDFLDRLDCTPEEADRFSRLIGRSVSLSFEISRYAAMGINLLTRADQEYPRQLKQKLGNTCPPIFYCAGNLALLKKPCIGYAGSREVGQQDLDFTAQAVQKTAARGFGVVSGGAKGVDTAAESAALDLGQPVIVYLADSLLRRIKRKEVLQAVQGGRMVLLSTVKPDSGFQTWAAMARNRLVYCQSSGTVVVRSDWKKGGTWAGASECLKHQWRPVFCWDKEEYPGNAALIKQGAIGIDETWDGDISHHPPKEVPGAPENQLSLFDFFGENAG